MGWVLVGAIDPQQVARCLQERGWRPVRIGGQPGFEKPVGPWVWLARLGHELTFTSWIPEDAQAHRHAEGIRRLREEVEAIARELGLSLPQGLTLDLEESGDG